MKLHGQEDYGFEEQRDFTGRVLIPFDFNTVAPLLQRKPSKAFTVCHSSIKKLLEIFGGQLTKADQDKNLLVLMRIKRQKNLNEEKASKIGWRIASLMGKDSLVTWAAQEYSINRFDFYLYTRPRIRTREISKKGDAYA